MVRDLRGVDELLDGSMIAGSDSNGSGEVCIFKHVSVA